MFSHFFKMEKSDENGSTMLSFKELQQNMNTQIRALTGGDITKEKEVLQMDCWRALTELEAKAIDYEELHKIIIPTTPKIPIIPIKKTPHWLRRPVGSHNGAYQK